MFKEKKENNIKKVHFEKKDVINEDNESIYSDNIEVDASEDDYEDDNDKNKNDSQKKTKDNSKRKNNKNNHKEDFIEKTKGKEINDNENKEINEKNENKEIVNKENEKNVNNKENNNKENKDNENLVNNIQIGPSGADMCALLGISENLLSHIKKRMNAIFKRCKIPLFNIEDYVITSKLGEGSYGIIYSVNKKDDKTKVYALKKIIARTLTEIDGFTKEFELVHSCDHSNIMKIYGICIKILDSTTYALYVLMELSDTDWDGEIRLKLEKRKNYTEAELVNILRQLTEALLFMQQKLNISHRDIKPQNILVFKNNVYKLADFGEAKEVKISKQLNTLKGTELYMSPALYDGLKNDKNDVSHDPFKSDVFSLGFCLLYAGALNFNLLYQVRDLNNNKAINEVLNENLKKNYSEKFIEIIAKMLEIDEKKRYNFSEVIKYINDNYQ